MKLAGFLTLRRVCFVIAAAAWTMDGGGSQAVQAQPTPTLAVATASSDWGAGYGSAAASDGILGENDNYWQTVQGKDQGAWFQLDLGRERLVKAVNIAWARYQDKFHSPPKNAIVQVSATGDAGSWKHAAKIGPREIPSHGAPYQDEHIWSYPLQEPTMARYVRLLFPEGGQPNTETADYICLGEVEALTLPKMPGRVVTLEGRFGKAVVDVMRPSLVKLYLRGPNGLSTQSLLAERPAVAYPMYRQNRPVPVWASHGYTYVVDQGGARFESRLARPDGVDLTGEDHGAVLRLTGVKLSAGEGQPPVAEEDWTLSAPGDGSQLVWQIVRRWKQDIVNPMAGSPALFFGFDARTANNSVTSTIWYDPLRIAVRYSEPYAVVVHAPERISENNVQTLRDRDTWAVYKLWTNWRAPVDMRLEVQGGHLYRRGNFAFLSEAGAVVKPDATQVCRAGQVEEIALKIGPADKYDTGYQLAVTLPDKKTERSLRDFYSSVFNGGAINDQKGFDFGNETDGYYYAGSSWMYGMTLAAGTPAKGKISSYPYDAAQAFRGHLEHIFCTQDEQGRAHFGYNQSGDFVDDNLHTIIGSRAYLLHSGDLAFVHEYLPTMERMLDYFVKRRNEHGLFAIAGVGAHWYYDCVPTSGINSYYNAFFFKAANDLAEMEAAAGFQEKARQYRELAESIKTAFNKLLWKEDAQGGPRYIDWIDSEGREVTYFCDVCQWPAVAVGIASLEQARKIVATADARLAQLEKENGYRGYAGLSALWPVPSRLNAHPEEWPFGIYMNGGSLLCQTYWEIMARAKAGDAEGAARRLKLFAQNAAETAWSGNNSADMLGKSGYPPHCSGEAYLADMVCVTAAAIQGVLGIQPTWEKLVVTPCLPADWPRAEADVLYKGQRHRVTIDDGKVQVQPLEQTIDPPSLWLMDFNLRKTADGEAQTTNVDFLGPYSDRIQLTAGTASGAYQSPAHDWAMPTSLKELTVAADLNGGEVSVVIEISDDGFKTVGSQTKVSVKDGVNAYPLEGMQGRAVRARFELVRQPDAAASPVVDGFRLISGVSNP